MTPQKTQKNPAIQPPEPWYTLPVEQALEVLGTSDEGLSSGEIEKRRQEHGRNELPAGKETPLWKIILRQFMNPLIYILIAAGALSLLMQEWADAGFIFAIIIFNAALGAFQEGKAEKSANQLRRMMSAQTGVIRDGENQEIDAEELVPGDIILLEAGRRVPADARLLKVKNLSADESLLTGESTTQEKTTAVITEKNAPVSDRTNCVFAGTTVSRGGGRAVIYSTGLNTELGSIARETGSSEVGKTPLIQRMEEFTGHISYAILGVSLVLVGHGFVVGSPLMEVFFTAVALAVAAIPEGLPIALTVALSVATERMAKRNVIVRRLSAVEGLGSCTLIASDKTGTLTQNRQTVHRLVFADGQRLALESTPSKHWELCQKKDGEKDRQLSEEQDTLVQRLIRAGALCNTATRKTGESYSNAKQDLEIEEKYNGDAMDIALLVFAERLGRKPEEIHQDYSEEGEIAFESEKRFAAKFFRDQDNRHHVFVKGAADAIASFCDHALLPGGEKSIDPEMINDLADRLSRDGYRVIALAEARIEDPAETENRLNEGRETDLRFLGLVGMIDPLRPEAKDAVNECKEAGIRVVMITGDHPATALSIARELEIAENEDEVRTGRDLSEIASENGSENEEFVRTVNRTSVFARVSPLQKLEIVKSYIKKHFVAVTGDGVNDAPALRHASIGVAMGSGTDVTKDTASIIVTDDNFASIVNGVEEGRFAYANVRKVVFFLIALGIGEIILISTSLFVGSPLPLTAIQILWLNFVTSSIQDIGLAFEAGEEGVLKEPPRNPDEKIFNRRMMEQTLLSGGVMGFTSLILWFWLAEVGYETGEARNMMLLYFVLMAHYHVFSARSETRSAFRIPVSRNWILFFGVIAAQGLHIGVMYIPFMQDLMGVKPVTLDQWLLLLGMASSVLIAVELYKAFTHYMKPAERKTPHAKKPQHSA